MDFGGIFKSLVWDNLVKFAIQQLFLAVPLLGWGPLGYIVSWVITFIADKLFIALKLAVDLEVIVLRNEEHKREYTLAAIQLKLIAKEKGLNSPEFKKAREKQQEALSRFIRFAT